MRPLPPLNLLVGAILIGTLMAMAAVSLVWTPFDPLKLQLGMRLQPPSSTHWFGTDEIGRDVLSRLMAASVTSVTIALCTVVIATTAGSVVGVISGYSRASIDAVLMICNSALLAFPGILLALSIIVIVGPNRYGLITALSLAYFPTVTRVVRGAVLSIREREFVEASRIVGNGEAYTMFRHVLPNTIAPIAVVATSMFGWVLLAESALSFIGLGVAPPEPTWGNMLALSRPHMETAWWLGIAPGVCIALTLLGVNLLGDYLRDRLDPRMVRR